jgi:hypothetical protein
VQPRRSDEDVDSLRQAFLWGPNWSISWERAELYTCMPQTNVHRLLQKIICLKPHKLQVVNRLINSWDLSLQHTKFLELYFLPRWDQISHLWTRHSA